MRRYIIASAACAVVLVALSTNAGGQSEGYTCFGEAATIVGTRGNDNGTDNPELIGTPAHDVIVGLSGRDVIRGIGDNDFICGNGDEDRIIADSPSAPIPAGNDKVDGGAGRDKCLVDPDDVSESCRRG
jgi:Ca2+-binding RTX toxin-like protein